MCHWALRVPHLEAALDKYNNQRSRILHVVVLMTALTSYDWETGVLRPRHHCWKMGWTQYEHVQKSTVGRNHQHRCLLQVCPATFDLHPEESQREEDGTAQQLDGRVDKPPPPSRDGPRTFLLRQADQS